MGGKFRDTGVLSGVGVCEKKICLRKAKRKWDVVREQGDVFAMVALLVKSRKRATGKKELLCINESKPVH